MLLDIIFLLVCIVLTLLAAAFFWQLRYALRHFTPPVMSDQPGADRALNAQELPSLTVCIPARNEQHALTRCLESVLASTYPKLEILVLDDVSGDDTSTLIKSFASEGVRFIQGSAQPKGWLGKNHALQGLLEQASGKYVLFIGVDTLLAPQALTNLMQYLLSQKVTMVSILPQRQDGWRASVVFSPLRFFWELMFHRRLWPAAVSNAWVIDRSTLQTRFQGFKVFKQAIQPETKIATELAATGEYRFLMSTSAFGFAHEKKWRSQVNTSIRLLYPLLDHQLGLAISAGLDLMILLAPAITLSTLVFVPLHTVHLLAAGYAVVFAALYGTYAKRMWRRGWWVGALLWPFLILQELILLTTSVVRYHQGTVTWKGRLIRSDMRRDKIIRQEARN